MRCAFHRAAAPASSRSVIRVIQAGGVGQWRVARGSGRGQGQQGAEAGQGPLGRAASWALALGCGLGPPPI